MHWKEIEIVIEALMVFVCCRETPAQSNHRHIRHKVSGLHVSGFAVGNRWNRVSKSFDVLRGDKAETGILAKGGAEISRMPVLPQPVCQGKRWVF